MKILRHYLRDHRHELWVELVLPALFLAVFVLYRLDAEPFLYAFLLALLLLLVHHTLSFLRYGREHAERQATLKSIVPDWDTMSEGRTLCDEDYRGMIRALGQRTRDLSEQRQREKQQAQGYYAMWTHQIKTPIAVMRMMLQQEDTEEHRELLGELFRIEQYAGLALNYIRLEDDAGDLSFREISLDQAIRASIRKYAPQLIAKKLKLRYEGTEITEVTDEKWLCFILEQLLSNAVKYTPSGSVTITVTGERTLSVSDTGIGIAPEDLPRIFEKGFTGGNGRTDKQATGLGLWLCRAAADRLGITLTAQSEPGSGSTFTLTFPASEKLYD